jgi:ATP-dependent Lhr-like helicase
VEGGFAALYPILRAMEEAGRIRRGYFVAGLGATQFAAGGAEDRLRALREPPEESATVILSATDPASPYGTIIPWPARDERLERRAGARVFLRNGELLAYWTRNERNLVTFLPVEGKERESAASDLVRALAALVGGGERRALLLSRVDGKPPSASALSPHLIREGFLAGSQGYLKRGPGPLDRWTRRARSGREGRRDHA